ncbi:DUF124-domain-containing protein [Cytidiella melzeri]|nr:DUF124-domain-containing protein [Cytidiella melzeri]
MSYPGYTPQQGYNGPPPPSQAGYTGAPAHHHQQSQHSMPIQGFPEASPSYAGPGQFNPPTGPPQAIPSHGAAGIDTSGSAEGVQYHIHYRDSNSLLSLRLQSGVEVKAKPGSMVAMDGSVQIKGKVKFSFKKLLKGGDLSESHFTGPGEVLVAPETWGDIVPIVLDGQTTWRTGKHAFLAATIGVTREYKSQGVGKGLFSGEGLFVAEAVGRGVMFVQSIGAIFQRQLRAGEELIVDNGHLVAWTCQYKVERIQAGGILSASHTDEGLVCRFTGPGIIYIQTRNPDTLISWINEQLPARG